MKTFLFRVFFFPVGLFYVALVVLDRSTKTIRRLTVAGLFLFVVLASIAFLSMRT